MGEILRLAGADADLDSHGGEEGVGIETPLAIAKRCGNVKNALVIDVSLTMRSIRGQLP